MSDFSRSREAKINGGPMRGGYSPSIEVVDDFILNTHTLEKLRRALKNWMNVNISSNHKEFSHEQKNAIRKKRTFRICNFAFWRINHLTNSGYWYFDTYDTCIFILSSCSWLVFTNKKNPTSTPAPLFWRKMLRMYLKFMNTLVIQLQPRCQQRSSSPAVEQWVTSTVRPGRQYLNGSWSKKSWLNLYELVVKVVELVSDFDFPRRR